MHTPDTSAGFAGFRPQSSTVVFMGYDPATLTLRVEYNFGTYHYADVPPSLWEDLQVAPSAGSFLHQHVKKKFETTKQETENTYIPNVPE